MGASGERHGMGELALKDSNFHQRAVNISFVYIFEAGHAVAQWWRYKPEGRGIDSRWCQNFSLT
jgi:hypothetical protein